MNSLMGEWWAEFFCVAGMIVFFYFIVRMFWGINYEFSELKDYLRKRLDQIESSITKMREDFIVRKDNRD